MTQPQGLMLEMLANADGMVDTHQLRLKMTLATGKEWTYDRTHAMLVRLNNGGLVARLKPRDGTTSRWTITNAGRRMIEGRL